MESTKPGRTPAPYGQACVHCVKAKSRCMLREGGTCERLVGMLFLVTRVDGVLNVGTMLSYSIANLF
jgi:hypothetical protein